MKVPTLAFLEQRKATIRADLLLKVEAEDWHGVADCAMDLREVEAQIKILQDRPDPQVELPCVPEWLRRQLEAEQEARRREVAPTI